jgi:Mitochondrial carrier protein
MKPTTSTTPESVVATSTSLVHSNDDITTTGIHVQYNGKIMNEKQQQHQQQQSHNDDKVVDVVVPSSSSSTTVSISTNNNKDSTTVSDMTRRMICGGLAGMIAKTATNPLERIKMLSQTGDHLKHITTTSASTTNIKGHHSIWSIYSTIIEKEGIIGLWAGNGANLIRVFPAKAVVFSSNDFYRTLMVKIHTAVSSSSTTQHYQQYQEQNNNKLPAGYSFIAGGLAGMSASMITYPLDFARGRISGKIAHSKGDKVYTGIIQTCALTIKDEGFFALYKGITPTIIGAMPYEGIKFGTVAILEQFNLFNNSNDCEDSTTITKTKSNPLQKMFYGSCGGIMAGLITYPNDTVRRLLQIQGSRSTCSTLATTQVVQLYNGYWDCVIKTYQQDGIKRFYRGATINILRMAPNTAIQFGSYELLKQWTTDLF